MLLCLAGFINHSFADNLDVESVASFHGRVRINLVDGRGYDAVAERGQLGVTDIKIAPDHKSVGWLVLYPNPDGSGLGPLAGKLVVWREGRVLQRFDTDQIFYS